MDHFQKSYSETSFLEERALYCRHLDYKYYQKKRIVKCQQDSDKVTALFRTAPIGKLQIELEQLSMTSCFPRCVSRVHPMSTKFGTSLTGATINFTTKIRFVLSLNDRSRVDYSYRLNFSIFFSDVSTSCVIGSASLGRRRTILAPVERPVHCGQ